MSGAVIGIWRHVHPRPYVKVQFTIPYAFTFFLSYLLPPLLNLSREIFVIDQQGYNVALNKPVTASALQPTSGICLASGCLASGGNNGIIDNTVAPADGYISSSSAGDAFWQVDLQGLYSISRVIFWNRADGTTYANRAEGATITLLNGNGVDIATLVLGTGLVQAFSDIQYYEPSTT